MTSTSSSANFANGMSKGTSKSVESKSSSGPSVVLLWMWNWFAALPKTVTNLFADLKSGELLSRFTLLDAMCQFIFAVATSCHPQEEPVNSEEETRENNSHSPSKNKSEVRVFQGTARTLRSRTVETN